ncbi:DUF2946 family protein [uncultured Variovorax sp.]|uniref:DUF2946 family protein n=1 Tax=uncultured Variovorax sp. TaxID=114708 RepID=UPI0025F204BD|nr:DUF2946 family protein [uncultured Variovorax sp.]
MHALHRSTRSIVLAGRWVLLWFVMSLGVAVASPLVNPQSMELVCSAAGSIKVVVHTEDGAKEMGASHMDCPLCVLTGAPPPAMTAPAFDLPLPLGRVVQPIPAARLAAATAAPLPARGPPTFS